MKIIKTNDFDKALVKLPIKIQELYTIQEQYFEANWRDPRLHIKKVRGLSSVFSFRITRRYRALFYFKNSSTAIFFEIDHRRDIYK